MNTFTLLAFYMHCFVQYFKYECGKYFLYFIPNPKGYWQVHDSKFDGLCFLCTITLLKFPVIHSFLI